MNTAQRIGYVHYIIYYGTVLEKVNNFIYLDSKMSHVSDVTIDIQYRIALAEPR